MQVVDIPTMKDMIAHAGVRMREPLWFHGPSGVGKTEGIHQSAADHGAVMCDFRAGQHESIDVRGIPDVKNGMTLWNMPGTFPFKGNPNFDEDGPPIFFFGDEMDHADPSMFGLLYQLFRERAACGYILMDNVVLIAASNRARDRGVGNRVPAPLNNGFTHAEIVPDIGSWSTWAAKDGRSPITIGFLNFRSALLHTFDPDQPQIAWSSPRTWAKLDRYFQDPLIPARTKSALMSGAVGEGPAVEHSAFVEIMASIVPIEQIIKDPMGVPVEERLDLQWAMATHVAGNMTKDNADPLHQFLSRLEPEMVVMAWTLAINRDEDITDTNAFLYGYAPQYRGLFQS